MGKHGIKNRNWLGKSSLSRLVDSYRSKRIIWLAAVLAFFVPTVAASAWYAGTSFMQTQDLNGKDLIDIQPESARSSDEQNSQNEDVGRSGSKRSFNNIEINSQAVNDGGAVKTEVTINGKKFAMPQTGSTRHNSSHSTSSGNVSININSQQSSAGDSGSSSTTIHSNSSTYTNSNNNSSTTIFNSYSSSP